MSEDKGFEVVDKRGSQEVENTPDEEPVSQTPLDEAAAEEPQAEQKAEEQAPDVYAMAMWMIGIFASTAWQSMGLQVNPITGKVEKDLTQAKVAIDCAKSLSDHISSHLEESQRRELRGIIGDLQVNFVNQSKES
ncbi:MAG: DUF1844 domain-containing protein [Armatimonadota bacterium]|nr:DUF1844 domain-containing protein [Armatimonadota bacterium]